MSAFFMRQRKASPFLEAKVWVFCVAAVLGLVGIYFDERWMTATAILLLGGAMFLPFVFGLSRRTDVEYDDIDPEEDVTQ